MPLRHRPLVCQYLEHAASSLLADHADVIRAEVGRSHGVYALYRRDRLYYVGLASNLRGRLKHHLKDRHQDLWDNFSIYLTLDSAFMKELESLILRIAMPRGNRQRGKFAKSQDLLRTLRRSIADRQAAELDGLFPGHRPKVKLVTSRVRRARVGRKAAVAVLARWVDGPMKICRVYKGRRYTATVRRDGTIRVRGVDRTFHSPSMAAVSIVGRPVNGWSFWTYERGPGKWVTLSELRGR